MIRHLLNAVVFFTMAILLLIQRDPYDGLLINGYMSLMGCFIVCILMGAYNLYNLLTQWLET